MSKQMSENKSGNTILKFAGVAVQMGVIIGLSAWGGTELDNYLNYEKPVFAVVFSLFGIAISLYLIIKEALKLNK